MSIKYSYPDSDWPDSGLLWFYTRDQYAVSSDIAAGLSDRFAADAWIGQIQVWEKISLYERSTKNKYIFNLILLLESFSIIVTNKKGSNEFYSKIRRTITI
ncbi:hypothetical protein [Gilliamella sp. W8145]|uniref:hypothetical protein n=1 Tax=Gilliamella sp. W8145 TaxID=2750990 RepID=UPI0018DD05A3|nr:hypothetical protein [Gilliamella sp. W8145]MBI0103414.1 hypothetical protein [Gilliamella sp. W8145]